ncbi:hypothetical protein ACFLWL_02240 [Chloroflexota bacterium]
MTAEIVIMNKEAIALASDSAVTMTEEAGQKIFTSANKLFSLSKYHPVGIMVYGNANFMDIPWETIIKIYREKELGKRLSRHWKNMEWILYRSLMMATPYSQILCRRATCVALSTLTSILLEK